MNLSLVKCSKEYWEFVRLLRINPINQSGFLTQVSISPEDQIKYMNEYSDYYNICTTEVHMGDSLVQSPVGYIGIPDKEYIVYCVSPEFQGSGIGTFMVENFIQNKKIAKAKVKPDNIASQKVFEKLNFKKIIIYEKTFSNNTFL